MRGDAFYVIDSMLRDSNRLPAPVCPQVDTFYNECMKRDILKVAEEADEFFRNRSPIHDTMRRLADRLDELNIPFAIAGAMAANAHGHRRTTADVDVLIRREDLTKFRETWLGRGWVENFEGSRGFRDTENNVKVDVLIVGDYPGDGLKKPVAFPEPERVSERREDGIPYINLPALIELKLASGMTAEHRMQDLADVMKLIRANELSIRFADQLDPYVHEKYNVLWRAAQVDEDY